MVATRWPVCQTPPRVVTHRICVENPNRTVSHSRSISRATPIRPSSHQHIPTPTAASTALIAGFQLVRGDRPDERDDRHEHDRRERGERDVEAAADRDDVVRARAGRRARSGRGGRRRRGRRGRRVPRRNVGSRASTATAETPTIARPTRRRSIRGGAIMRRDAPRRDVAGAGRRAAQPTMSVAMRVTQKTIG